MSMMNNAESPSHINGLILAGGQARRMSGLDKGLISLAGTSLVERCISTLSPQVDQLFISANRHIEQYQKFGFPILQDSTTDYAGPLAGLQRALEMSPEVPVLVMPCDSPLFTPGLLQQLTARLLEAYEKANCLAAVPHDGTRLQPLFGLFAPGALASLNEYLASGQRKVETWVTSLPYAEVDFSAQADSFMNINTEDDLHRAESLLANVE
jgi:molybdenum cofactor guanylyltransferase